MRRAAQGPEVGERMGGKGKGGKGRRREGRDGEVCRYKRLYIEWINSKRIAHGTVFNIL